MKILVNTSVPSLKVADSNDKGKVIKYDIIAQDGVVGALVRFECVDTWSIDTSPDYTFSIGFIGRLIQVMLEYQGPA
jgi:hypothetical protein